MKSEELEHFLEKLLKEGVAVPTNEEILLSEEGRMKVKTMGNNSKNEIRKLLTRGVIRFKSKQL